jgi:hypothetical protein
MKSILDRSFKYTPSAATDVRKTFERARQQLENERKEAPRLKVVVLPSRSAKASTSAG